MAGDLPRSGISLVVENVQQAIAGSNAFTKSVQQQTKAITDAAKSSGASSKQFAALQKDFSGIGKNLLSQIPIVGKFSNLLGTFGTTGAAAAEGATAAAAGTAALGTGLTAALPVIGAVVVALGAATLGFMAFWKAGARGAQIQNQLEAFGNVIGGLEDSTQVLRGLQTATRGTVSDLDLMRLTVAALQGQSAEFREVLLRNENGVSNLGKVFDITARAARASGQSVEIVREKFLTGLRLQSKLRLDDIGVTVIAADANKKYAESLGRTAESLTDTEKKQAFLNEALRQLDRIGAEAPISKLQDALARIPVVFQNIKDKLALAIQPIFEPIAMFVSAVVAAVGTIASYVIPVIATIANVIGTVLSEAMKTAAAVAKFFFGDFVSGALGTSAYVIAAFQLAGEAIVAVVKFIGSAIREAISLFGKALGKVGEAIGKFFGGVGDGVNLNINQLAFNLGKGGAQIAGAFAAGLIKGGTYVLQAVTEIAQIVADFLMGFSPPKRGVLHNIDKGAENVATSWVDGFLGGIQKSFGEVLGYVNDRLGEIASLSRDQIETRLAQLDVALRPFKENLAIVKADMEAIAGFTDPAMKIMERQRTALLKAFGRGDAGLDVERLRTQDRQIQRLKELKELGQDQVDQAELQLALANSQQAQERALLGIALDRMGAEEKIGDVSEKAAKASSDAMDRAKGGGGGGAATDQGTGAGMGLGGELPDLLSNDAIDAAKANIVKAISGVVASATSGVQEGLAGSGFSDALASFNAQKGALGGQLGRIQDADPAQKIADKFAGLKDKLTQPIKDVREFFNTEFEGIFGEEGTVTVLLNSFRDNILKIFTGDDSVFTLAQSMVTIAIDTIVGKFSELKDSASLQLQQVRTFFETTFINADSTLGQVWTKIQEIINNIIGDQGFMRLVNDGEGTLKGALSTLGEALTNAVILPAKTAMEALVNIVIGALNGMIREINKIPTVNIHEITPFQIDIGDIIGHARGTLGDLNPFMAGERGKELVVPSRNNPLSVFPNKATMALDRIGGLMQRMGGVTAAPPKPQPMSIYLPPQASSQNTNNNTHNNNSNNRNVTINPRQSMTTLEMRRMMAGM